MKKTIATIDDLREYFARLSAACDHHGPTVNEVIFPLMTLVIHYSRGPIYVHRDHGRDGMGRVLWVTIEGHRYAMSQTWRENRKIDMRAGSTRGATVATFDNRSTMVGMRALFEKLARKRMAA